MVKRDLFGHIGFVILLILGLIALRVWVFEPVTINQQMANDYLTEKEVIFAVKNADIDYGDFVAYKVDDKEYVGRIVAKAGDKVTYMDDVLYRNDMIVAENYLNRTNHMEYYTEDLNILTITGGKTDVVTEDSYFILNDVRTDRRDSRQFGLIPAEQIVGRLTFRISPLSEFGFIKNGLAQ